MISDLLYLSQQERETPRTARVDAPGTRDGGQRRSPHNVQDSDRYGQPNPRSRNTQYSKLRSTQTPRSPKSDPRGSYQSPLDPELDSTSHSQDPYLSHSDLGSNYQSTANPDPVPANYQQEYYQQSQSLARSGSGGNSEIPIDPTAPTSYPQNLSPHPQDYEYGSPITSPEQRSRQPYILQTQSSAQPSLIGNYQSQDAVPRFYPQLSSPSQQGPVFSEPSLSSDLQNLTLEHPAMDTALEDSRGDLEQSRSDRQGKDSRRTPQDSRYRKGKDRDHKGNDRKSRR
jgi:hypothetical protein